MENNISLKQFTQKVEALVRLLQEKDAKIALLEAEKEELRKEIKRSYAENVELQNKYDNLQVAQALISLSNKDVDTIAFFSDSANTFVSSSIVKPGAITISWYSLDNNSLVEYIDTILIIKNNIIGINILDSTLYLDIFLILSHPLTINILPHIIVYLYKNK